jgi:hypothetical protein
MTTLRKKVIKKESRRAKVKESEFIEQNSDTKVRNRRPKTKNFITKDKNRSQNVIRRKYKTVEN